MRPHNWLPIGPPDVNANRVRVIQACTHCGRERLVTMAFRNARDAVWSELQNISDPSWADTHGDELPWGPVGHVWYSDLGGPIDARVPVAMPLPFIAFTIHSKV